MFVWRGKWRHRDASNPSILHLRCLWRPTRTDLWKTGPNNESKPSCHTVAHFQPSIFDAARHIIRCRIQDAPRCNHAVAVFTQRMTYDDISSLSTHDQVLMAQICGGRCRRLATYHNIVDPITSAVRPHTLRSTGCKNAPQQQHNDFTSSEQPTLSILVSEPHEVILYARETLTRHRWCTQ